jgi:predicted nucleotidyltransferase
VAGVRLKQHFDTLLENALAACEAHYGDRLVSLVVFGSVGRGVPGPESDLDLLVVADDLPQGRLGRVAEFRAVERALGPQLEEMSSAGLFPELSPVFKTPPEVDRGSPLFLDMVQDARILYDREGFMQGRLARLEERLNALGARRIWRGNAWFWDLKPDYKPGEVFEL